MRKALVFNAIVLSASQQYAFDFSDAKAPTMMEAGTPLFTRMLQFDPEEEPCYAEGPNLVCRYGFELGDFTNPTQVAFIARCDLSSTVGFDYRKASGCSCQAQVTNPESGAVKVCPCTICQADFGETPIQVDCATVVGEGGDGVTDSVAQATDPFVYSTCTSVDCSGACNGTCTTSCEISGVSCPFCEATVAIAPNTAPVSVDQSFPTIVWTSAPTSQQYVISPPQTAPQSADSSPPWISAPSAPQSGSWTLAPTAPQPVVSSPPWIPAPNAPQSVVSLPPWIPAPNAPQSDITSLPWVSDPIAPQSDITSLPWVSASTAPPSIVSTPSWPLVTAPTAPHSVTSPPWLSVLAPAAPQSIATAQPLTSAPLLPSSPPKSTLSADTFSAAPSNSCIGLPRHLIGAALMVVFLV